MSNKSKLNESQLRHVVREGVKKVLSELDWKTYASAAQKDNQPKRKAKFAKKAAEEFNKNFGETDNVNYDVSMTAQKNGDLDLTSKHIDSKGNAVRQTSGYPFGRYQRSETRPNSVNNKTSYPSNPHSDNRRHARALQKADDEFQAWKNNDYFYEDGKYEDLGGFRPSMSWHRYWKESEERIGKIIDESIKKVVNEGIGVTDESWNLIQQVSECMSIEDILSRIYSRLGEKNFNAMISDILAVEGCSNNEDEPMM